MKILSFTLAVVLGIQIGFLATPVSVVEADMAAEPFERVMAIPSSDRQESAFKNMILVSDLDIKVPTVVEVPIPVSNFSRQSVLVKEINTGSFIGSFVDIDNEAISTPLSISTTPSSPSYLLSDGRQDRGVDFAVSQGGTDLGSKSISAENQVTLNVRTQGEPITTSQLNLFLDRYVALPRTVKISAALGTNVVLTTIVAEKLMTDTIVTFPEVTASYFEITFTYAQPLRITEVSFSQKGIIDVKRSVRFLAQPNSAYAVYYDADRFVDVKTTEAGNLQNDEGVVSLGLLKVRANGQYVPADVDGDGVRDLVDNCVQVSNPDQIDLDNNGRGDVCDDFDRDGRINIEDNCVNSPNFNQADEDGDGIGDVCDSFESRFTERNPWVPWVGMGMAALTLIVLFILVARGTKPILNEEEESENNENSSN